MDLNLYDIALNLVISFMDSVHTATPGEVQDYDGDEKTVSVLPVIKKVFADGSVKSMPIIRKVPVMFPGSKNTVIQFPLKKGDTGMIFFSERSLEKWLSSSGGEVLPDDPRMFDLSDALFYPGGFPPRGGKTAKVDGLKMQNQNCYVSLLDNGEVDIYGAAGNIKIMTDGVCEVNGNSKRLVTYAELNSALQTMLTALNADIVKANGQGGTATGTTTLDISASQTQQVKVGG